MKINKSEKSLQFKDVKVGQVFYNTDKRWYIKKHYHDCSNAILLPNISFGLFKDTDKVLKIVDFVFNNENIGFTEFKDIEETYVYFVDVPHGQSFYYMGNWYIKQKPTNDIAINVASGARLNFYQETLVSKVGKLECQEI